MQAVEGEIDTVHISFLHGRHRRTEAERHQQARRRHRPLDARSPSGVRGQADALRPVDRRAAQCRRSALLLAHHAVPAADLCVHSVGVGLHERRHDLDADRRQPLLAPSRWRHAVPGSAPTNGSSSNGSNGSAPPRRMLPTEPGTFTFPDGIEIDTLIPTYNRSNRYGLDRSVQRKVSFSGMPFIPTQDQAMTEGMGYVCDRTREHLGTTDLTIIHMRRLMLRLLKNMEQGIDPPGAREPELYRVRPLDVVSDNAELPAVLEEYRERRSCQFEDCVVASLRTCSPGLLALDLAFGSPSISLPGYPLPLAGARVSTCPLSGEAGMVQTPSPLEGRGLG